MNTRTNSTLRTRNSKLLIIGLGNPLMGDDGLGVAAVERLQALDLPPGVEVIDGGTGGLALLDLMPEAQRIIIIDAADFGRPPGTLHRVPASSIAGRAGGQLTLHAAGLPDILALGREMDLLPPDILLFAVQPLSIEPRLGLSEPVERVLPELVARVLAELS